MVDMAKGKGRHRKERDLPKRALRWMRLLYVVLRCAVVLLKLVEAIIRAVH